MEFPFDNICVEWYFYWIFLFASFIFWSIIGYYFSNLTKKISIVVGLDLRSKDPRYTTESQLIHSMLHYNTYINRLLSSSSSASSPRKVNKRIFEMQFDELHEYRRRLGPQRRCFCSKQEISQIADMWFETMETIVIPAVNTNYNILVPKSIWNVIINDYVFYGDVHAKNQSNSNINDININSNVYSNEKNIVDDGNNNCNYMTQLEYFELLYVQECIENINETVNMHNKFVKLLRICYNLYILIDVLIFVLILISMYILNDNDNRLLTKNENNGWISYQQLNAALLITYFVPRPLFIHFLIGSIYHNQSMTNYHILRRIISTRIDHYNYNYNYTLHSDDNDNDSSDNSSINPNASGSTIQLYPVNSNSSLNFNQRMDKTLHHEKNEKRQSLSIINDDNVNTNTNTNTNKQDRSVTDLRVLHDKHSHSGYESGYDNSELEQQQQQQQQHQSSSNINIIDIERKKHESARNVYFSLIVSNFTTIDKKLYLYLRLKYCAQILIGLPLIIIGCVTFIPIVLLAMFIAIFICKLIDPTKFLLNLYNPDSKYYYFKIKLFEWIVLLLYVFFVQNAMFAAFNLLSGHLWVVSSFKSFMAWDQCYDNDIFAIFSSKSNTNIIETFVWIYYWIL